MEKDEVNSKVESNGKSEIQPVQPDQLNNEGKKDEETKKQPSEEPQPAKLIDNEASHYQSIKHKGSGSFGIVSKSIDKRSKKTVAIKKVAADPKGVNRELQLLKELRHPNCIGVLNSFKTEESMPEGPKLYLNIVMEYIPDNLYTIIRHFSKTKEKFPETLVMVYSYQLFRCLHYLKSLRIMHRDIKPQNMLVDTRNHQIYLCDFGSAKKVQDGESNVSYICSRFYRAPELLLGNEKYDMNVDTWSVGCVIAEMVLGEPLFTGENTKDQMKLIISVLGLPDDFDVRGMGGKKLEAEVESVKPITLKKKMLGRASPLCIDLLTKTLVYNPDNRISPINALLHPFFDSLREKKVTINKHPITDLFNFQPEEIGGNERYIQKLTPKWYYK